MTGQRAARDIHLRAGTLQRPFFIGRLLNLLAQRL